MSLVNRSLRSTYLDIPNLWLHSILAWFEKIDVRLLIFLLLSFNWASFTLLGNEEMYFGLAKQYIDPNWIKDSFLFTEFPGTRLIFQWLAGFGLQYLSFEQLCFLGRLLNFALLGLAIGTLFRYLKISNLATLFLVAFLWRKKQTFFAHEWIFGGFEAKTLAYVFIFTAVYLLLKERWYWATICVVIATYFHVLVGGWFFLILFIYHFISQKSVIESFKVGSLYTLLIAPWLYYLAKEILLYKMDAETKAMLDHVYVFVRNPHHIGIFMSWEYFSKNALEGFLLSLVGFALVIWCYKKEEGKRRKLALLLIVVYSFLFLCCLIALSDHAGFLKFYPFRIASIAFLLSTVLVLKPIGHLFQSLKFARWLPAILFLICIGYVADNIKRNVKTMQRSTPELDHLASFAKANTPSQSVFLFKGLGQYTEKPENAFYRKAERDGWIQFKFVPSGGAKLLEWNKRNEAYKRLEADLNELDTIIGDYEIDYLISLSLEEKPYLKLIYENEKYKLYEIQ